MRLAVPRQRCRFVVGATAVRPVVAGVFPPERAAEVRAQLESVAAVMSDRLTFLHREIQIGLTDLLYFGGAPWLA